VTVLSFTPFEQDLALMLKKKNPEVHFTPLYFVAHFTGARYFPERYFGFIKKHVWKMMRKILEEWDQAGMVRFFNKKQQIAQEDNYNIRFGNDFPKVLPPYQSIEPVNTTDLDKRARRVTFNIISVARFDFPQKQYVLGLVNSFAKLKPYYPQISLNIIGYGPEEHILQDTITRLPETIKNDIHLLGSKSNEEIDQIMKDMHLNISSEGCVACGGRNAVVSLPARLYYNGCEVYGYLPDSFPMLLSTNPGLPIETFIEELIKMPSDEYKNKCLDSYNTFKVNADIGYTLRQHQTIDYSKTVSHHLFFELISFLRDTGFIYKSIRRRIHL